MGRPSLDDTQALVGVLGAEGGCGLGGEGGLGAYEKAGAALPQWGGGHTCLGRPPAGGPPAARLPPSRPELEPGASGRNRRCGMSGSQCVGLESKLGPHAPSQKHRSRVREQEPGSGRRKPRREGSQRSEKPGTLASGARSETEPRTARREPERGSRDAETSRRREGPGGGARGERRNGTSGTSGETGRGRSAGWPEPGGGEGPAGGAVAGASSARARNPWGAPEPHQQTPERTHPPWGTPTDPRRSPARPPA